VVWEISSDDLKIVSGWVNVRTRRVYDLIKNGVSHLKSKKFDGLVKQKNMTEILDKCQEYYVIEGKSLPFPIDTVAKYFDLDLRQKNMDYIKEFVPIKGLFSFEMTQNNTPHLHLMVAGVLSKPVQKHLRCLPNPTRRDETRGGAEGFVGYLRKYSKPTCISSCRTQKEIDIRNIEIYLGHLFNYQRISGKKFLSKTYVVDGVKRVGSVGECRSRYLKRNYQKI
jgi:hypothetical protein